MACLHSVARRSIGAAALIALLVLAVGCNHARPDAAGDPEMAAYVKLMMPRKIEIQRYLTKPVSFTRNGDADGLEVILSAQDSFGDPTKVVGVFFVELHKLRKASSDRVGDRVAFWKVVLNSDESMTEYWDRLSRFYRFPVKLQSGPLPPGDYILQVRLMVPGAVTLFDEYELIYKAEPAPPPTGA